MARAQTPQQRRIAVALKLAPALEKAADLINEFRKAHRECADDPKASDRDSTDRLGEEMRELGGWLETAARTWSTGAAS